MGIGQLFKKREEPQEEENLKEMFENIKSQEIPHKTGKKVINFTYVSKCGCGSTAENPYHAIVPEDYDDIKDGDIVDNFDKMAELERIAGAIYEKRYRGSVEGHDPYNFNEW